MQPVFRTILDKPIPAYRRHTHRQNTDIFLRRNTWTNNSYKTETNLFNLPFSLIIVLTILSYFKITVAHIPVRSSNLPILSITGYINNRSLQVSYDQRRGNKSNVD